MKRLLSMAFFLSASVFYAVASETNDSTVLGTAESIMNEKSENVVTNSAKKVVSVTVGSAGDINNDGVLSISDIVMLSQYNEENNLNSDDELIGAASFNAAALDVNSNGKINSKDLNTLVEWVLSDSKD